MSSTGSTSELKGQARRGAQAREAIIGAALEVFAVRGYRSGALAEIATKVGLTPAGILYHFGSKEELLLAVIGERDRRAGEMLDDLPEDTTMAALRTALMRIAELCEREPGLAALHTVLQVESFEPDASTHPYFLARSRFVRESVERALRRAQGKGEIAPGIDCAVKAAELLVFQEGAAVLWLLDDQVSIVELYRSFLDSFIASLT